MANILGYLMNLSGANEPPGQERSFLERLFNIQREPIVFQNDTPQPVPPTPQPTIQPTPQPTPVPNVTREDFDQLLELFAQKAVERGFHPGVLASQFAAESQRGQSRFARERNNFLGLGAYTQDPNKALSFDSPEESMDYYLNLISTDPRYKQAFAVRDDPNAYLKELSRVPYATDPNYARIITNTPEFRRFNK